LIKEAAKAERKGIFYNNTGTSRAAEKINMTEKYVLLIEDNPEDAALTQLAFRQSRIANPLIVVYDGQEALDFLFGNGRYAGRDISQLPAVILLDLKLAGISGLEVLKQVRLDLNTSRIPVVVLSSTVNQREIEDCYNLGINRYFRKPGNYEQFKKIIQEIRNSWLEKGPKD
jgi:CheY-like chemotaxis protein